MVAVNSRLTLERNPMVSRYIKAWCSFLALSLDLRCSWKHERSLWTDFSYSLVAIVGTSLSFQVYRDNYLNQSFGLILSKGLLKARRKVIRGWMMVYHETLCQWPSNTLSLIECSVLSQFRNFLSSSWRLTYPKWPKTALKHPFSGNV